MRKEVKKMAQIDINALSSMMQGSRNIKKVQNDSNMHQGEFEKVFESKLQETKPEQKTKYQNQNTVQDKTVNKTASTSSEDGKVDAPVEGEFSVDEEQPNSQDVNPELHAMIQSMEKMLEQIHTLLEGAGDLDNCTIDGMVKDIKAQLADLLTQMEKLGQANLVQGDKLVDLGQLNEVLYGSLDALDDLLGESKGNEKSIEMGSILEKLEGVLQQHVDQLNAAAKGTAVNSKTNYVNPNQSVDSFDQNASEVKEEPMVHLTKVNKTEEKPSNSDGKELSHDGLGKQESLNNTKFLGSVQQTDAQFVQVQQESSAETTAKIDLSAAQHVKASNIMEQVTNKIQINVGDELSEMTLQLKPENLGKLDMKISIERGIVVARFVAESQMVKEVIESNFNSLKDALNEKGLAVQELSVFVGNDSNRQNQQNFMNFKRKPNKGKNIYDEGTFAGSVEEVAVNHSKSLNVSKVDFFA
jgi:hypothetical protein